VESTTQALRERVGDDQVICALSGGVDSSVVAVLLHNAIGRRLHCIFVNNGLLRKGKAESVQRIFRDHFELNLIYVDSSELFLEGLKGVTDPERKRKIIGNLFIELFEKEAKRLANARYLAQGTLYPDVIESVSFKGPSATIKTHHNVGGLPERMNLELIEPLRELFKDEVRLVGRELGLPLSSIMRSHCMPRGESGWQIHKIVTEALVWRSSDPPPIGLDCSTCTHVVFALQNEGRSGSGLWHCN